MGVTIFPAATNRQTDFTSSGTWVCPAGVYSAQFMVVGAGGGGGGIAGQTISQYAQGGGGGGGSVKNVTLTTIPGSSYTITVGAKGTSPAGGAGTNGGFSEVVLSGTTLVRSWGGTGGVGILAGAKNAPVLSATPAGGGGEGNVSTSSTNFAGGGGGTNVFGSPTVADVSTYASYAEGSYGQSSLPTGTQTVIGGAGFNGYGAGGGGGYTGATVRITAGGAYSAGAGGQRNTTGTAVGVAAVANSGSGGGGAATFLSTAATAGGNGADGLVRVVYFG
jgi:hypothetical protein